MAAVTEVRMGSAMQARVRADQLKWALVVVAKVARRKPPLNLVRVTTQEQGLVLETTDGEVRVRERVPAVVAHSGVAVVPVHLLSAIIRLIPDSKAWVSLAGTESALTVGWERSAYHLVQSPTHEFPDGAGPDAGAETVIDADALRIALERALWAVSDDDSRPWMTGVRVTVGPEALTAMATDSTVIGRGKATMGVFGDQLCAVTVPAAGVRLMIDALRRSDEAAAIITMDAERISVAVGGSTVICRCIDGQYPDLHQFVPQTWDHSVEFDRAALLTGLRRLNALTRDGTRQRITALTRDGATRWVFGPVQDVRIQASLPDVGEAEEAFEGTAVPSLDRVLTIGINAQLVIRCLSTWTAQRVRMEFSGPRQPFRLTPVGEAGCEAIIMPLITV